MPASDPSSRHRSTLLVTDGRELDSDVRLRRVLGAREFQQTRDEAGKAQCFGVRSLQVSAAVRSDPRLEVLEPQAQRLQGRAQLVRRICGERLLGPDEVVESRGHQVEGRCEGASLRWARHLRAHRQIAAAERRRGRRERFEWAANDACKHDAQRDRDHQYDGSDRAERLPCASRACIRCGRRVAQANRAADVAARCDGHSDVEQGLPERARRPRPLRDDPAQRRADLGPACEAPLARLGRRRVDQCAAIPSDDDDARSRVSRVCAGERPQGGDVARSVRRYAVLQERRKRESVPLDIARELTALSARELDAQRDREREQDNQRERDVGGDQAPRHVARKRKPTPRTVWIQPGSPSLRRSEATWTSMVLVARW